MALRKSVLTLAMDSIASFAALTGLPWLGDYQSACDITEATEDAEYTW